MEHKIIIQNDDDELVELACSCGWVSNVNKKFMSAVSDRHLNLTSEKGNAK